jgi:hypothetical protein
MAQEKAQEEAPRAPASGKGGELEKQRTLLDSRGSESFPSALSTDPAAIPRSSHLPHLKEGRSGTSVHGKWENRQLKEERGEAIIQKGLGGSRTLLLPSPMEPGTW